MKELRDVRAGTQDKNLKRGTEGVVGVGGGEWGRGSGAAAATYHLARLQLAFLYSQDHVPKRGTSHSGQDLPASIVKHDNLPQICLQEFSLLCQVDKK